MVNSGVIFCTLLFYQCVGLPLLGYGRIENTKMKAMVDAVLLVLEARFNDVLLKTADAVRSIKDLEILNRLTKLAAKCDSLAEFNQALEEMR